MPRVPVVFAFLATLWSLPLAAQFVQYVPPGSLGERTEDAAENAKQSAESARWNLGRIALDPRFSVRELGYYENAFASPDESSSVDDFRATLGAGLAAYLNAGSKSLFSVYLTPEYSYWQDQEDLSGLSTSWGAGWFGLFNNLTATARVGAREQERPLSDEVEAPLRIEEQLQDLSIVVALNDAISVQAAASSNEVRHASDADAFVPGLVASALDRDATTLSASVSLSLRSWKLGVGLEDTDTELLLDPDGRSNTGQSPFARIEYQSDRIQLELTAIDRELSFDSPALGEQNFEAGSGRLRFVLSPRTFATLYGARTLALSTLESDTFILQDRFGAAVTSELGDRFELTLLVESGESEYRQTGPAGRRDDLSVVGGFVRYELRQGLRIRAGARNLDWDSNQNAFDRSQRSLGIDVVLGSGLFPW